MTLGGSGQPSTMYATTCAVWLVPDASIWPLPLAHTHTFGGDSDADSVDVDLRVHLCRL
jgi:hypothetical protein